jgi:hypothetical protein
MNTYEFIRCFDIASHLLIFIILIWEAIDSPQHKYLFNITAVITGLLSLFLAVTCWKYGRSTFFLTLHTIWEYGMLFLFLLVFFAERKKS